MDEEALWNKLCKKCGAEYKVFHVLIASAFFLKSVGLPKTKSELMEKGIEIEKRDNGLQGAAGLESAVEEHLAFLWHNYCSQRKTEINARSKQAEEDSRKQLLAAKKLFWRAKFWPDLMENV